MLFKEEDYLAHVGTPRHSGRYPYGSGANPNQSGETLLESIARFRKEGLNNKEIARGLGIVNDKGEPSTTRLIALNSIAKTEKKMEDIAFVEKYVEKQYSNTAIARKMTERNGDGIQVNESSIRALREPGAKIKAQKLMETANMLEEVVDRKGFVQIGVGVENRLGISKEKLGTAVTVLQEKGYRVHTVQVDQPGTKSGQKSNVKVLAPPGTEYLDVKKNLDKIVMIDDFKESENILGIMPPISISSKRVAVVYGKEGGTADGVIYVRPGAKDLSLGGVRYAQVRIKVDDTHFLKGMAMYKDDLPPGKDLVFNTPKSKDGSDLNAMKPLKTHKDGSPDEDNPFGSIIEQIHQDNDKKKPLTSAMNIVNEAGDWDGWSRNLSSQTLSKQSPRLAKEQLDMTFERKRNDLDRIMGLTNPAVRKKLLDAYALEVDSSAVHLKAAALPRSSWHVILPMNSLKVNEIYAPNYNNGEVVALIRYPHGGKFEIPELVVNNKNPKAKTLLGIAQDAVAINAKVAERLSGADFDGDAVLVIPNANGRIKTTPGLEGMRGLNLKEKYKEYPGMKLMTPSGTQTQMGIISNLITDMTIKGASREELTRAIKHSQVVIDAEKHKLNYKQSELDNNIVQLKQRYQVGASKGRYGASTLISRAKSRTDVNKYKLRRGSEGGPIDKITGELVKVPTNETYMKYRMRKDPVTGKKVPVEGTGKLTYKKMQSKKLIEAKDARTLMSSPSGMPIERVYAEHSNRLKDLANQARLASVHTQPVPYSSSANKAYAREVASLNNKLNTAKMNRPLERQALLFADATIAAKIAANPEIKNDKAERKKLNYLALEEARQRTGAKKQEIEITPYEWNAIQAGALHNSRLVDILKNSNLDTVKKLATPNEKIAMTPTKQRRAEQMLKDGYTQSEVAAHLGVSVTTLKVAIAGE